MSCVLGGDDLDAARQACGVSPIGATVEGRTESAGISGPEELIGRGHALAVDVDGPLVAFADMIMRKSGRGGGRTQQHITVVEEFIPPLAQSGAAAGSRRASRDAPWYMGAEHLRQIAVVVRRKTS